MYSLEEMIITFQKHEIKARADRERFKKLFIEENPGQPLPDYMEDDFCITTALLSICSEIKKLRDRRSYL